MTEPNPDAAERKREAQRKYKKANRVKLTEYQRQWRAANLERARESERRSREANRDKKRERDRQRYAANREQVQAKQLSWRKANGAKLAEYHRQYYADNRKKVLEQSRRYYQENLMQVRAAKDSYRRANPEAFKRYNRRYAHGLDEAARVRLWQQQDGKCYLCRRDLALDAAVVEHWHGCAGHNPKKSCPACRRGLACHQCNVIIGFAGEDPDVLRRIADSLEVANRLIRARQVTAPLQLQLGLDG